MERRRKKLSRFRGVRLERDYHTGWLFCCGLRLTNIGANSLKFQKEATTRLSIQISAENFLGRLYLHLTSHVIFSGIMLLYIPIHVLIKLLFLTWQYHAALHFPDGEQDHWTTMQYSTHGNRESLSTTNKILIPGLRTHHWRHISQHSSTLSDKTLRQTGGCFSHSRDSRSRSTQGGKNQSS